MTRPYPDEDPQPEPSPQRPAIPGPVNDDAYPWPASLPARPRRRSGRAAAAVGLVVAALGAPMGWLWAEVSPRLDLVKLQGGLVYAASLPGALETEPQEPVAADGWFAIIGFAAGVVVAVLAWFLLRRYRGIAVLAGLTLGSLAAALIAGWVGYKIGYADFSHVRDTAKVGDHLSAPLELAMTNFDPRAAWPPVPSGVLAIQALIAAFVYTVLAGFSAYADLRGDPVDDQFGPGVTGSSDSAIGTART